MGEEQILNILLEYDYLFERYSFIGDSIRVILMLILKFFRSICNVLDVVYDKTFEMLNIMNYAPIQELIENVKPFILLG